MQKVHICVARHCVLYVKALKDNEKVELFSTP